ncbi:MAG: FIG00636171: hypothetical protein, partial [uncultured Sphingomonas sp.]
AHSSPAPHPRPVRLRRRHHCEHCGGCRHPAGESRLCRRRCRDHQPVGSRPEARPRAAQARGKSRQGAAPMAGAVPQADRGRPALPTAACQL